MHVYSIYTQLKFIIVLIYRDGAKLYVTYSLNGKEHKTSGVEASSKPCWLYEKCIRLDILSIQQAKVIITKFLS